MPRYSCRVLMIMMMMCSVIHLRQQTNARPEFIFVEKLMNWLQQWRQQRHIRTRWDVVLCVRNSNYWSAITHMLWLLADWMAYVAFFVFVFFYLEHENNSSRRRFICFQFFFLVSVFGRFAYSPVCSFWNWLRFDAIFYTPVTRRVTAIHARIERTFVAAANDKVQRDLSCAGKGSKWIIF